MAKKRANGEGSIRKRKDGRWEGRYTAGYDPSPGKRIIKNVLGKTQAEVKERLHSALEEIKGIDVARAEDYTVATWLHTWYASTHSPTSVWPPPTVTNFISTVTSFPTSAALNSPS